MSTHEQRIQVFTDTFSLCKTDKELIDSIALAKKNTWVYHENDYPYYDKIYYERAARIVVSKKRSFESAIDIVKEDPDAKVAVLNFANAFHPGGGVTKGSSAQEESLCRCSTLYPLLYRKTLKDAYYDYHKKMNDPKASDSIIYTKGVKIIKTDSDLPMLMDKKEWVDIDVITCAAPDLRKKSNPYAPVLGNGTTMGDEELFGIHVRRAIHILSVAAYHGATELVLGAFGCGAFENNPTVVAKAYKTAIDLFSHYFFRIEFAIYCKPGNEENYEIFKKILE